MIKREAKDALIRLSEQFPIVAITGPRQSGKTTLAKETFPNKKYVSFDDQNMRNIAMSNPDDFLLAFPDGAIIDEAQKVPGIFSALKKAVDEVNWEPGKYVVTGSSQFRLKENINETLAGRIGTIKLLPFSIQELKENSMLKSNAYEMAFTGFYPPLHDENKKFQIDDWYDNYIDTYIDMDVRDQIRPSHLSSFKKFVQECAIYSGQILNMDSISKAVGVSAVTIKEWLSILENSFLIHMIEVDNNDLGKQLIKSPKLYFIDTGLLCHLLRIENYQDLILNNRKGAIIETMAVSELLKKRFNEARKANLTYFRDKNGYEVDIIADWKKTYAIEVKCNNESEAKLSKNVRKYVELKGANTDAKVYYLGNISIKVNNVEYISWIDW